MAIDQHIRSCNLYDIPKMRLLLVVAALISVVYALPTRDSRIIGGNPVSIETYPFMASVEHYWRDGSVYEHTCGGSLITSTAVLSATHCYIKAPNAIEYRVRLGSTLRERGGTEIPASRIILHPEYEPVLWIHDVAIVRLSAAAPLSNRIQVARIAGPNYPLPDNLRVDIAGWGDSVFDGRPGSWILRHTYVHIINQELCAERYAELKDELDMEEMAQVTPEMFCAGLLDVGGQDACSGDSGGPALHGGDIVVGITSWGYMCGHPRYPGVYVRVPSYTQWIVDNAVA